MELTDGIANLEGFSGGPGLVIDITNGGPASRISDLVHSSKYRRKQRQQHQQRRQGSLSQTHDHHHHQN